MARRSADEERARLHDEVQALEARVTSLVADLDDTTGQVTQASQQRDRAGDDMAHLTEQLHGARAEAEEWRAECDAQEVARRQAEADREAAEVARRGADEERARLHDEVQALEAKVSSLFDELDDTAARVAQANKQRDIARDETARATEQLRRARGELVQLQAGQDETRAAAGRGIARAAEAARLLSETLAEVLLTGGEAKVPRDGGGASRSAGGSRSAVAELAWTEPTLEPPWYRDGEAPVGPRQAMAYSAWDERAARHERPAVTEPDRQRAQFLDAETDQDEPLAARRMAGAETLRPGDRRLARVGPDAAPPESSRRPERPPESSSPLGRVEAQQPDDGPAPSREAPTDPAPEPRPAPPRRRPVPLPPSTFYDSVEAAEHLVAVPGIVLLVDGHDATNSTSGPTLPRHQLVADLADLAQRAGTQIHVVFEEADLSERFGPPAEARRQMRVTFSPDGVPPAQVLRDLIDQLDSDRAVVVATDDHQLEPWARRWGGNVLSMAQLAGVLSRKPEPEEKPTAKSRWRKG
jgi:hypothetical protein